MIGHSQGEIAAAYIAGVLSLPEAARVVARRSQALSALCGAGTMASVLLGADELQPRLRPWSEALSIAATNGTSHTIISGDPAALEELTAACDRDGIHIRAIAVDYASHSAQIEPLRERLLAELADLTPMPASVPLYSTVGEGLSAGPLDTTTMDADYWYRNLREPVRFHDRVVERLAAGECTFVELSPHPVLAPAITDTLAQAAGRSQSAVITTLHRERSDQDSLATALAQLHNHGHSPSWRALYPDARTVELPTYPFEQRRYWLAPTPTGDASGLGLDRAEHPLLGAVTELADQDQIMVSGRLSPSTEGWLAGHQVNDTVLFPATGFIEVLLRAGELAGCPVIDELILHTALTLSEQAPTDLQILVDPLQDGRRAFTVHARTGGQPGVWTLHASGELSSDQPAAPRSCRRRVWRPSIRTTSMNGWPSGVTAIAVCSGRCGVSAPTRPDPRSSGPRWRCPPAPMSPATVFTPPFWTPPCTRWPPCWTAPVRPTRRRCGFRTCSAGSPCMPPRPPSCTST